MGKTKKELLPSQLYSALRLEGSQSLAWNTHDDCARCGQGWGHHEFNGEACMNTRKMAIGTIFWPYSWAESSHG
jgi:hypothetical protein